MRIIRLEETDSTNRYLREHRDECQDDMTIVTAGYQTAGRGQGTNTWESEAGQNLLFSMLVRPGRVPVASQYVLSMGHALALCDTLTRYTDSITIKWPNDIYWKDRKISGTLIELGISNAHVNSCIFGTGVNVNQQRFLSDAPNPVSLCQILGHDVELAEVLDGIVANMRPWLHLIDKGDFGSVSSRYHEKLYRRTGFHAYRDNGGLFMAELLRVEDKGHLVLRDQEGRLRCYAFKEVRYVLE